MNHIMLDLETLSTKTSAVVLSVGAVVFDPYSEEMGATFYAETSDLNVQEGLGRTISASTVQWWMQQDVLAKRIFQDQSPARRPTMIVLMDFSEFLAANGGTEKVELWGNGSDFDNAIMASMYNDFNIVRPWSFRNNRCFRTMKGLYPQVKVPHHGVAHNALDDAITQAVWLQAIMKEIKGGR